LTEAIDAARALLPGASWVPYLVSGLPFFGGLAAAACGERRVWLVAGLWGAAMAGCWGGFNPLGLIQWVVGGVALAAAGWACLRGRPRRRHWLVGPPLAIALGLAARQAPKIALTTGVAGSPALVEYALERAGAGEVDEGIVYAEAAVQVASTGGDAEEEASAELVLASLYAAGGDCTTAVTHARAAHMVFGSDLPKLDEAIRDCFSARGP
jgi:hypothetical protein